MEDGYARPIDDDEIDLVELIAVIISGWKTILFFTLLISSMSFYYAFFIAKPFYTASATFLLKGEDQQRGGANAMLGALGGGLLGGGSSNNALKRLELMVNDLSFAIAFVEKHNLLPTLFPDRWDSVAGDWLPEIVADTLVPDSYDGGRTLRDIFSVSIDNREGVVTVSAELDRPELLVPFVYNYVHYIDSLIVHKKQSDAKGQIAHLESRYRQAMNPWLQRKLEDMIASQYEQMMLFNETAIDLVVVPLEPRNPAGPNKKLIVAVGLIAGLFGGVFAVFFFRFIGEMRKQMREVKNKNQAQVDKEGV